MLVTYLVAFLLALSGEAHAGSDGPLTASVTVTLPDGTRTTVEVASSIPENREHPHP